MITDDQSAFFPVPHHPKAYEVCQERDFIPEMVFLLGRMGDNKKALGLIIERLGDVERVSAWFVS